MNAFAETILSSPVRDIIGAEITYLSPRTKRKRVGSIQSVSASGLRVINKDERPEFVTFRDLIDITTA